MGTQIVSIILLALVGVILPRPTAAQTVSYTYDTCPNGVGRLCTVTDSTETPTVTTSYEYDGRGNVTTTAKTIGTNTFAIARTYDSMNRLQDLTYPTSTSEPTGEKIRYSYNNQGLLDKVSSVTYSIDYVKNLDYNAQGQITLRTLGNDATTRYGYADAQTACPQSNSFRLCTLKTQETTSPRSLTIQDLTYGYDNIGNIESISDLVGNASQGFTYDSLDRLRTASSASTPIYSHTYSYSVIGNILCNTQVSACPDGSNYEYPLPAYPRPHAVSKVGDLNANCATSGAATCFEYDNNGNLTSKTTNGVTTAYSWDFENRLTSVTQGTSTLATFRYDHDGKRVRKTEGGETIYVENLYECKTACTKYIFAGSQRVAQRHVGGLNETVTYLLTDHLGSTTKTVGGSTDDLAYYPYGSRRSGLAEGAGTTYRFTGQELDNTQLYYYGARYYDSSIGRFISPDAIVPSMEVPQTLNRYSYVSNNPLRYRDPSGKFEVDFHLYLVAFLAYHAGFSPAGARILGQESQGIDTFIGTNPLVNGLNQSVLADYHAFIPEHGTIADVEGKRQELIGAAILGMTMGRGRPAGIALHFSADKPVHGGSGYRTKGGAGSRGHALAGTDPDKPYKNRAEAIRAARDIYSQLTAYSQAAGGTPRSLFEDLMPVIERFVSNTSDDAETRARETFLRDPLMRLLFWTPLDLYPRPPDPSIDLSGARFPLWK
ncbi:MAG: RHS repeat domain-containing protein [Nitrospirota bacterium]